MRRDRKDRDLSSPTPGPFTLIELLVVVAIIAILAAMLLPVLSRAKVQANLAVCKGNLHQIGLAWRLYLDDFDEYLPHFNPAGNVHCNCFRNGVMGNSYDGFGLLFYGQEKVAGATGKGYLPDKQVYRCPGHSNHGGALTAADNMGSIDYALGWFACGDWPTDGLRLKHNGTGAEYIPPSSDWVSGTARFTPRLDQFMNDWPRPSNNPSIWGARIIFADAVDGVYNMNPSCTDGPHLNISNFVMTDLHIEVIPQAFTPGVLAVPNNVPGVSVMSNVRLHQPWTEWASWWAVAEKRLR